MTTFITSGGSDASLLAAVAEGDRQALQILYERHAPWLTLRLARRCADRDAVDDALQDTFVAVWRAARRYHGGGEVGAWFVGHRDPPPDRRAAPPAGARVRARASARRSSRPPRSARCSASSTATSAARSPACRPSCARSSRRPCSTA